MFNIVNLTDLTAKKNYCVLVHGSERNFSASARPCGIPGLTRFPTDHFSMLDDPRYQVARTAARFESALSEMGYRKSENRATVVGLDSIKRVTVLDSIFLFILICEIIFIFITALSVQIIATFKLRLKHIPTTISGLSKCSADQNIQTAFKALAHVPLKMMNQMGPDTAY